MAVVVIEAALLIHGTATLTAAHATHALGLEPTRSHEFGDARPGRSTWTHTNSFWSFGYPRTVSSPDDYHGMASLATLVDRFVPLAGRLTGLRDEGYETSVSILGESDSDQIGLVISLRILHGLSAMGTPLIADFFVSEHETDVEGSTP